MAKEERKAGTDTTATVTGSATRRLRLDTSNLKSAYCNFFNAQDNANEVVLNFGFSQDGGSPQRIAEVQLLQQVILHPATARRVKNVLVALFDRRDARRSRPDSQTGPGKKNRDA